MWSVVSCHHNITRLTDRQSGKIFFVFPLTLTDLDWIRLSGYFQMPGRHLVRPLATIITELIRPTEHMVGLDSL